MVTTLAPNRPVSAAAAGIEHPRSTFTERDAVVARVMLEAHDRFLREGVSEEVLDRFVVEAADEIWSTPPKVTAFVPILALRVVSEKVRSMTAGHHATQPRL